LVTPTLRLLLHLLLRLLPLLLRQDLLPLRLLRLDRLLLPLYRNFLRLRHVLLTNWLMYRLTS
jgi:hypothetical protein